MSEETRKDSLEQNKQDGGLARKWAGLLQLAKEHKKLAIGIGAAVLALIVILIIVLIPKGSKSSGRVAYLEGLDVMCGPNGIVPDGNGRFLVTDVYGKKIWRAQGEDAVVYAGAATQKDSSGQPLGGYRDDVLAECLFQEPWAIAPFLGGYAVSDTGNHVLRLIRGDRVETINGHSNTLEMGEMGVTFDTPTGLASDGQGNLYVADTGRGIIYVISEQGEVSTYCTGLNAPMGICWHDGALYVAETGEHRIMRVQNGSGTVVAGTSEEGDADGPAKDATFSSPQGVAVGSDGSIYVCDTVNASVRKIKDGNVSTILRMEEDQLVTYPLSPVGACFADGKLYVCDPFSRRVYVLQP